MLVRRNLLIFIILTVSQLSWAGQTVYQWQDSQGDLHFSDMPRPGAKKIQIKESQTYQNPTGPAPANQAPEGAVDKAQQQQPTVTILSPADKATIRNTNGVVEVSIDVKPALQAEQKVQLYIDGKAYGAPVAELSLKAENVFRGEHSLVVSIIDKDGSTVSESKPITIFVHLPRVNQNSQFNQGTFYPDRPQKVEVVV